MPPFFVVGAQRSGTTMLRLMLNSHARLAVPFESSFTKVLPLAEELGSLAERDNQRKLAEVLAEERFTKKGGILVDIDAVLRRDIRDFGSFIDAVFSEWASRIGKPRWGVKTPGYVTIMDVLVEHFPTAQFVHLVRDGRDVALSNANISWGWNNVPRVAEDWKYKCVLGRKMGRILGPKSYYELRFEDLVLKPEESLRGVCRFLGEEFDPHMLLYHEGAERDMPESSMRWHRSSVSAPDRSKVYAWKEKMPLSDQILFDEHAGDTLELFGYERVQRRHTVLSKLKQIYYAVT